MLFFNYQICKKNIFKNFINSNYTHILIKNLIDLTRYSASGLTILILQHELHLIN